MNTTLLLQLLVNGVIVGALYGVVAMCFVLIYKASQVVNFAQGEFLLIGAWVCWWMLTTYQIPFVWGFLITLAFMLVFGVLLQIVVLRPLIGEPIIAIIMVTIGLSIRQVFALSWAISAMVSAVAGIVIGIVSGVSSGLSFYGIKVFPAVILGGLDSIVGGVVGGIVIGVLENFAHYLDSQFLHW